MANPPRSFGDHAKAMIRMYDEFQQKETDLTARQEHEVAEAERQYNQQLDELIAAQNALKARHQQEAAELAARREQEIAALDEHYKQAAIASGLMHAEVGLPQGQGQGVSESRQ